MKNVKPSAIIQLTRGLSAIVDVEDLPLVNNYKWHAKKCGVKMYAASREPSSAGKKTIYMHRLILAGEEIDHRDGDGLNNKKCNLRVCSRSQNNANRHSIPTTASGYRGVYLHHTGKWYGRMTKDGRMYFTERVASAEIAVAARDKLALLLFGEFASLNKEMKI